MEQFLDFVIRTLVEYPNDIAITKSETGNTVTFHIKLHQNDIGKIIGRNGHVIDAIRHILNAAATRHKQRVKLNVIR